MPDSVIAWLALWRRHGTDLAAEAATAADRAAACADAAAVLAQQLAALASATADSAKAFTRTSRAHEAVLRLHQPDAEGRCREDGQPWPCRSIRRSAAALSAVPVGTSHGDSSPPQGPSDAAATQELPVVRP